MYLTEHDVRGIAAYTRIELDESELAALTVEFNAIIESLKPITEYDLEGVEPTFHPIAGLSNVMREDTAEPVMSREVAMELAQDVHEGQYRVLPILGEGGEQ
ncbi:MAG: Asp-tRNA(Asn)/Glu-tRNA(Gln) amidotransferase subunit GatC [Coriobacteriia bacterium]|jgi:aspartyl-tRNA(Asn)/glutamyl-tRNA(Gln) amidotransferase subunit C|nr:Asp-tRNA(Asn)/Glu-tRNA(Gln) amidotransferase subunit GatC [Coriobacteriia bacterium]MDR2714872.1 Asp-tRNA(Asn)/Glu-tRNA(Gln) amidotransferase subunit GatC [Coriobacteriales bacterium]